MSGFLVKPYKANSVCWECRKQMAIFDVSIHEIAEHDDDYKKMPDRYILLCADCIHQERLSLIIKGYEDKQAKDEQPLSFIEELKLIK